VADETLTLALHGEVSLDTFSVAIEHWRRLLAALTREVAGEENVEWIIEELAAGSATATVRAVAEEPEAAAPIVSAYVDVGEALAEGRPEVLTTPVRQEAVALTQLINGDVDFIRLETAVRDLIITTNYDRLMERAIPMLPLMPAALGGVQGRIQTLTSRGALRFTLYDVLFDRAVNCYLHEGQEEIMRDVWGATAVVEGTVTRDPDSGRPLNVRGVWNVTPAKSVERFAYLKARGAVEPPQDDDRTPEDLVATARDV
jgi:hypothetical protein